MTTVPCQSIPEFFAGKNIFVTGGTGLVGKILVEKLLRSCPDIGNIYLVVRPRRNVPPEKRLEAYINNLSFSVLRKEYPDVLHKIKIMKGNVTEPLLGLSPEDCQVLKEEVNIVFHAAASVRFDDSLQKAILTNVSSTFEMVKIALEMKNLQVFTHISTAYSNCDRFDIEEKIYPAAGDWKTFIKAAETLDPITVNMITKKIIGRMPNTYIFSKSLAEHIINDHKHLLPVLIMRPSVVVSAIREPIAGYAGNFNGPNGLIIAVGKGVLRVGWGNGGNNLDCVPVDVVIKAIIIATWKRGVLPTPNELDIYNTCANGVIDSSFNKMVDQGLAAQSSNPLVCLYYPMMFFIQNRLLYLLLFFLTQLSMACFIDLLLLVQGQKTRLIKIQRHLYTAIENLHYFIDHTWNFHNQGFLDLEKDMLDCDIRNFQYLFSGTECFNYFVSANDTARGDLIKETLTQQQANYLFTAAFLLHYFLSVTAVWLLLWACYVYSLPQTLLSVLTNIVCKILIL